MKLEYLLLPGTNTFNKNLVNSSLKNVHIKQHKPNLTDTERESIYNILCQYSIKGKLPRGLLREISARFDVKPRTVSRIWQQGQDSIRQGYKSANVCSKIKFNSGRKKSRTRNVVRLQQIEYNLLKNGDYNKLYIS